MILLAAALGLSALAWCGGAIAADPGATWPLRTPAQVGLNVSKLNELRAATGWTAGSTAFRGFVVKNGFQVYTWGSVSQKGDWASATKPLMSTMLFYAVNSGRTPSVNAQIAQYGWPMTAPDQSMTWHHLANMVSGYALPENPGVRWSYNDMAIVLYCRTLFTQSGDSISVMGQTMAQAVAQRLAPLQFQDGGIVGAARNGCQLFASVRDAARLGQFWMNKGRWRGVQMLPASYFDSFRKNQIPTTLPTTIGSPINDYLGIGSGRDPFQPQFRGQGRYGYNWWFNTPRRAWTSAPTDVFAGIGHHNAESIFVLPSLQVVFTCKCKNSTTANLVEDGNRYLRLLVEAHQ